MSRLIVRTTRGGERGRPARRHAVTARLSAIAPIKANFCRYYFLMVYTQAPRAFAFDEYFIRPDACLIGARVH